MKIHLIAIGGAVMHNLAIALKNNGHEVTGSDDEINSPSRERLAEKGLLPPESGWFPDKISKNIDLVILGMHARKDNPELQKAAELGLNIQSFPSFIGEVYKNKYRVVVAGSHGKTTTTSMIAHVLKLNDIGFDYLIGSNIQGFETMVSITDAPLAIIEGDEYLSSPLDMRSKFLHYSPKLAIITGIAWDHINVFPSFESYTDTFKKFVQSIEPDGMLVYYANDQLLNQMVSENPVKIKVIPYEEFKNEPNETGQVELIGENGDKYPVSFFGKHNLENFQAAYHACRNIGLSDAEILSAITSFTGAGRRMELLCKQENFIAYLDFAHAPSKLKSTINAVKCRHPDHRLLAVYELHTFSSLNPEFLNEYANTMESGDIKVVYYNEHTLKMKNKELIREEEIHKGFNDQDIKVITDNTELLEFISSHLAVKTVLLWMSSGNFGGLDVKKNSNSFAAQILY